MTPDPTDPPPGGPITITLTFKDPATGVERRVECATFNEAKAVADDVFRQLAGRPSPFIAPPPVT